MLGRQVERDVAEAVDPDRVREGAVLLDLRQRERRPLQRAGIDRFSRVGEARAQRQVGGDGGEQIAPVEGRRCALEREPRGADVDDLRRAAERVEGGGQQPVVGGDEQVAALGGAYRERAPVAPDARVDDGEMDRIGRVGDGLGEDRARFADVVTGDPVGDVDDPHVGRDPGDHGPADAREVVGDPIVGEEGDGHASVAHLAVIDCRGSR